MWPFPEHREVEKISRSVLIQLLPDAEFISCVDRVYSLPTNSEVLEVLGKDNTVYIPEINDCDDFAYRAKGLASGRNWPFAVVYTGDHYLNGWINNLKEWAYMEPQTREIHFYHFDKIKSIFI